MDEPTRQSLPTESINGKIQRPIALLQGLRIVSQGIRVVYFAHHFGFHDGVAAEQCRSPS